MPIHRRPIQLPLVRRSSHAKAMQEASLRFGRKIDALRAELDQSHVNYQGDFDSLKADRDRLLSQTERMRADLERLESEATTLRPLAQERDEFAAVIDELKRAQADLERSLATANQKRAKFETQARERKVACDRLSAANDALSVKLDTAQHEANQLSLRAQELESERDRLSAAETELIKQVEQSRTEIDLSTQSLKKIEAKHHRLQLAESKVKEILSQTKDENALLQQRVEDYRAECDRLGLDSIQFLGERDGLREENNSLNEKTAALKQQLRFAKARDPLLIGTFPRSGTWMLKYFLHFQDHFSRSNTFPNLRQVFDAATDDSHYLLRFERNAHQTQLIAVSHWMCPGVFALDHDATAGFRELLEKLGCFEYQNQNDQFHSIFAPHFDRAKILFVYRNPFDVYRSYADIFERRSNLPNKQEYPFNPMAPFGTELMNSESDRPFEHFVDGLLESNFIEFFAAFFMSYLYVKDAYPEHVKILRYEDAMTNRKEYLKDIVEFGNIGDLANEPFGNAFTKAIDATELAEIKKYESELGHAISGGKTFYGESNSTHLSTKKRDWREIFSRKVREEFCDRLVRYEPRILEYLPELNTETEF